MSDPVGPLEEAVRLSPENVPLRLYLASTLAEKGYWSQALDHYEQALQVQPGNLAACLGLGQAHLHQGEPEKAARVLRRGLNMDPEKDQAAKLQLELARALFALNRAEEAREQYREAIRLDSSLADRELTAQLYDATTPEGVDTPLRMRTDAGPAIPVDTEEKTGISFKDVGGMQDLKEKLRMAIVYPFQRPEIFRAYGKTVGGGLLLYGPPGCGKTYIARATAGEIESRFISVGLSDIMDMWYGESERKLHELFEAARSQAPTVLFFDEVEALGHSRTKMAHYTAGRTLVNQFLSEMDGISSRNENLLVIGATNSPWDLDPAFRRPGRFDQAIFVAPPDSAARIEILKLHLRNKPVENLDYDRIAGRTEQFSGADLKALCDMAAEKALSEALRSGAIRKIATSDFWEVLKRLRPSTSEWLETAQNYTRYSNRSGLYNDVAEYLDRKK